MVLDSAPLASNELGAGEDVEFAMRICVRHVREPFLGAAEGTDEGMTVGAVNWRGGRIFCRGARGTRRIAARGCSSRRLRLCRGGFMDGTMLGP